MLGPCGPQNIEKFREPTVNVSTIKLSRKDANNICDNYLKGRPAVQKI